MSPDSPVRSSIPPGANRCVIQPQSLSDSVGDLGGYLPWRQPERSREVAGVGVLLERGWPTGGGGLWVVSAEAFDVHGDGGQDMLDVGLGCAVVATAAGLVAQGELGDGALDSRAQGIAFAPGWVLLVGAVLGGELV